MNVEKIIADKKVCNSTSIDKNILEDRIIEQKPTRNSRDSSYSYRGCCCYNPLSYRESGSI